MTTEFFQIAYWCDDEWCHMEDLEEKLQYKSDDYAVTFLSDSFTDEDIDKFVHDKNRLDGLILKSPLRSDRFRISAATKHSRWVK